jgi:hypothetical protein
VGDSGCPRPDKTQVPLQLVCSSARVRAHFRNRCSRKLSGKRYEALSKTFTWRSRVRCADLRLSSLRRSCLRRASWSPPGCSTPPAVSSSSRPPCPLPAASSCRVAKSVAEFSPSDPRRRPSTEFSTLPSRVEPPAEGVSEALIRIEEGRRRMDSRGDDPVVAPRAGGEDGTYPPCRRRRCCRRRRRHRLQTTTHPISLNDDSHALRTRCVESSAFTLRWR